MIWVTSKELIPIAGRSQSTASALLEAAASTEPHSRTERHVTADSFPGTRSVRLSTATRIQKPLVNLEGIAIDPLVLLRNSQRQTPFTYLKLLGLLQLELNDCCCQRSHNSNFKNKPVAKMTKQTSPLSALARSALAEFIATALFVWVGCGTAVSSQAVQVFQENPIDKSILVTVSLAFGLAISVLVYAVGPISGGHLNPAVTMAFVSSGLMPVSTGALYVLAQCLGAVVGAALVWGSVASPVLTNGKGSTAYH
jgi:Major intrinsic protein